MRDLPAPTPSAQQALARMYAQRVPSRPKQIGRMPEQKVDQPWYEKVGRAAFGIVASPFATALDVVPGYEPEDVGSFNIFEQGGKSLQHVAGDAYQLGRSILTGKDTLSESPSARAYQQAGGGLMGTAAAALPYVDVASVVAPFAKGMTPAGALAIERAAGEAASSRALGAGIANARPLTRPSAALAEEMVGRVTVERPASNVIQFPGKRVQSSAEPIMSGNKAFLDELTRPTSFDTEAGLDIQQRHMSMYEPNAVGTNPEFGVTYDLVWAADNPYAIDITETYGQGVEQIKQTLRVLADKHGLPIVGPFTEDPDYYRAFLELKQEGFPVRLVDKQDSWEMVNVDGEQFKQLRPEVSPSRLRPPTEPSSNIVIKVLEDPDTGLVRLGAYNTKTETIVGSMQMSPAGDGGPMVVTGLVSDNPIAMLKMLAAAKAKAQMAAPGMEYPLYPDTSLSAYSRPLVERLQRANLVDPQFPLPDPIDINSITRDDWTTGRFTPEIYLGEGVDVNPAEYASIYDETRRALRESRQPGVRLTTSSNQLTDDAAMNRLMYVPSTVAVDIDRRIRSAGQTLDEFVQSVVDQNFERIARLAVETNDVDNLLEIVRQLTNYEVIGDMEKEMILRAIKSQLGI